MEMMTMMMDLDKLPDPFSHPYQPDPSFMNLNFPNGSSTTNNHCAPLIFPTSQPVAIPSSEFTNSLDHFPRASWFLHKPDSVEAMREMIFRMAALQPVQIDPEVVKPPKRRNVKISKDPQSVAARHRRERISERIRILQRLVPGGTKMDTASMLDEAVHYMKFLKKQVESLEQAATSSGDDSMLTTGINNVVGLCPITSSTTMNHYEGSSNNVSRACGEFSGHMVGSMELFK